MEAHTVWSHCLQLQEKRERLRLSWRNLLLNFVKLLRFKTNQFSSKPSYTTLKIKYDFKWLFIFPSSPAAPLPVAMSLTFPIKQAPGRRCLLSTLEGCMCQRKQPAEQEHPSSSCFFLVGTNLDLSQICPDTNPFKTHLWDFQVFFKPLYLLTDSETPAAQELQRFTAKDKIAFLLCKPGWKTVVAKENLLNMSINTSDT